MSELEISEAFPPVVPPEDPPEPTDEERAAEEQRVLSQRALQHRAEMLVEMSKTDAFQALQRELEARKARMHAAFSARLMIGDEVDQRQVDYDRGFIDGLGYIDKMLEGATNLLKRLDREADGEPTSEPDDEGDNWA